MSPQFGDHTSSSCQSRSRCSTRVCFASLRSQDVFPVAVFRSRRLNRNATALTALIPLCYLLCSPITTHPCPRCLSRAVFVCTATGLPALVLLPLSVEPPLDILLLELLLPPLPSLVTSSVGSSNPCVPHSVCCQDVSTADSPAVIALWACVPVSSRVRLAAVQPPCVFVLP